MMLLDGNVRLGGWYVCILMDMKKRPREWSGGKVI